MPSENLYVLRVRLSWAKGVWRDVAIRGDQTLYELHRGVLDAFEWVDHEEPNFRYYLSDAVGDEANLYETNGARDPYDVALDALNLEEDQVFLYVFGAGDRNQFKVRVASIEDPEPGLSYPDVIDETGIPC
ncbi:MAG: plasmid pRiA4b ORF-3 family protein, partial [Anaerolineae bacterium]|nr:plasmid pRiA4b ORF-3 family protein [Anaerolineae bacterium]